MTSGIYCILNTLNDKCYIGSALDVLRRLANHRSVLSCGYHPNDHLQSSWAYHGAEAFTFSLHEELPRRRGETDKRFNRRLVKREQAWIDHFDSMNPEHGYNQRGAERPGEYSDEALAKMRKPRSPEHRASISAACRGKRLTSEQQARQRAACRTPEYRENQRQGSLGRKRSPETREKISRAQAGRKLPPEWLAKVRATCQTPAYRAKQSLSLKRYWARRRAAAI